MKEPTEEEYNKWWKMTKVFEAIDWLKNKCYVESPQDEIFDECLEVIEKALLELKAIKEAKPSEALEAFEKINEYIGYKIEFEDLKLLETEEEADFYYPNRFKIERYLLKSQKHEQALEIIKKHKLLNYILKNYKCAIMYHLTDEEIKLLKEVRDE